jgi:Ser/Thr protein kinase RdoA (MazF antagonist)
VGEASETDDAKEPAAATADKLTRGPTEQCVHPYARLTPDLVLDAVERFGFLTDGRLLELNSYENRVYQVGLEDATPVVVKLYRPERWSEAQILEEHAFALELAEHELPVAAPLRTSANGTLIEHEGFQVAVFARLGGHAPDLSMPGVLEWLGRLLGRLHAVGAVRPFRHRLAISPDTLAADGAWLLDVGLVPAHLLPAFSSLLRDVMARVEGAFAQADGYTPIRLHGDCHAGNVLWVDHAGPRIVDLDDARNGPAVQDLWMLLSGEREDRVRQIAELLEGYELFRLLDPRELLLIEPLRAIRLVGYAAWLGRRWQDPAFPRAFPWFASPRYWEDLVLTLREQLAALDEPPLPV